MTEKDKDFLEGLAISAACHVLPARKVFREPIAYSYNGVILPKLPEWDREMYPYVSIHYYSFGSLYMAVFSEKPIRCIDNGEDSVDYLVFDSDTKYKQYNCDVSYDPTTYEPITDKWESVYSGTAEDKFPQWYFMGDWVWANHDIIVYGGSSVYLSASEPIPVYE